MRAYIILLPFLLFTAGIQTVFGQEHTIPWSEDRKLTWDDFQGEPDRSVTYFATTKYGIKLSSESSSRGDVSVRVICLFDKDKSWKKEREHQSPEILQHEQLHFDIGEVHARKMRRELEHYLSKRRSPAEVSREVKKVFRKYSDAGAEMQQKYDRETDHSINEKQQEKWNRRVASMLEELRDYALE